MRQTVAPQHGATARVFTEPSVRGRDWTAILDSKPKVVKMSWYGGKWQIPDWRQSKIEGIKDLEWTQKALADKGLKDPWLR